MEIDLVQIAMKELEEGNFLRGEELLLEAAVSGNGHAAHNLGTLYATGAPGIEADRAKSQKLYEQALALGFEATIASDPTWFRRKT